MKIALVEKNKTNGNMYRKVLGFDYDSFALTDSKKTKILKADVTLDFKELDDYDYVILVGADPNKHIAKVGNITKYSGELIKDKYIPLINPAAVRFRPELKDTFEIGLKKLNSHINGTYKSDLGKYEGVRTTVEAERHLRDIIANYDTVALDTETTSLHCREGYLLGIVLSWGEGQGIYIESECIDEDIEKLLQEIINTKEIVFHHAKFDIKWLQYHLGLDFSTCDWHDTMLEHYLLNENEAHDLKSVAMKYTKMGDYDKELDDFKRKYCKENKILLKNFTYDLVPFEIMEKYAGADGDATLRLHTKFKPVINQHFIKPYKNLMLEGTKFLIDIEETGVPFSRERLKSANITMTEEIYNLKQRFYAFKEVEQLEKKLDVVFNPNSTAHLQVLFFDILGFPSTKKTAGGARSTDKEVLERLAKKHEIPKLVSEIRSLVKLKSTYIDKVLLGLNKDQRLRTGFHLHTVTSGRLSSSGKLNMQQLPRDDKTVKSCIVPIIDGKETDEWVIFSQDLTTAEMYYAAALSRDKNLMDVFISGGDFHSSIAQKVFKLGCAVEDIPKLYPQLRQAAKAISFGIMYGAGPSKVAETAGISFIEARESIDDYFGTFPGLNKWINTCNQEIENTGATYSHFGRKRRVPNVFSASEGEVGHSVRSAFNFKVQSVASDINLLAAIDTHKWIQEREIPAQIFGLVHDSILGMVRKDVKEDFKENLRIFTQAERGCSIPGAPIGVDFGSGESYAKAG